MGNFLLSVGCGYHYQPFVVDRHTGGRDSMNEKTINLGCVIAYMLWAIAFALIAAGWVVGTDLDSDVTGIALMSFGLASSAGAATATIRRYFVVQNRLLKDAFDLGREARHAAGVRRITH